MPTDCLPKITLLGRPVGIQRRPFVLFIAAWPAQPTEPLQWKVSPTPAALDPQSQEPGLRGLRLAVSAVRPALAASPCASDLEEARSQSRRAAVDRRLREGGLQRHVKLGDGAVLSERSDARGSLTAYASVIAARAWLRAPACRDAAPDVYTTRATLTASLLTRSQSSPRLRSSTAQCGLQAILIPS